MRINIELDTESNTDLAGLTALIMALLGDTPEDIGSPIAAPAPPAATIPPPPPAPPASESLIEAEAARASGAGAAFAATAGPSAPDVDKSGLPYDERIHSSTKAVNQDGTWRNKRGVDPALVASVTAELRAASVAPAPPAPPAEPEAQSPEAAFTPPAGAETPPAPPAPPAPPVADGAITYPSIIMAASEKGLTYDQLNQTAVTLGLAAFKDLVKRPDLYESFMASLGGYCGAPRSVGVLKRRDR